ncbi:MAG TPA: MXAN_5187 C-terminal domain-containing protein [Polyangiaceae bacterium]|nr:MXAN_5187 C-terminal domain-containing protein [Polyangiaceae bacterium]
MRIKIIAVNALIVAIVGLLSFLLVRSSLGSATSNKDQLSTDAQEDVNGAAARLQLDGLRAERWLAGASVEQGAIDALAKGTASARGEAATRHCEDVVSKMKNASLFERNVPTLVAIVDAGGKIVGRNNSNLNRGDDLGSTYPGLKATLASGQAGSDVWYESDRYLATYVAVRDDQRKIVGAVVIGRPLNDTLSRVSEATTGRPLVIVVPKGDSFDVVAHSALQATPLDESVAKGAREMLKNAFAHQQTDVVRDGDLLVAASPLPAFEDGKRALLVAAAPAALIQDPTGLAMMPIFGAMAMGIVLVIVAGWLLGNYITRPINMLEEGLLAILNGQTDKRFELDHAELGGLAFRIDQLINQLMGVEEDTTDAEGRVSGSPNAANFTEALAVDDRRMQYQPGEGTLDPEAISELASEPPTQYYARIYREYISAKGAIGEATEHITEQAFATRIQAMERDATNKYGRPVRYQVQARNKEVVLLAVPLP